MAGTRLGCGGRQVVLAVAILVGLAAGSRAADPLLEDALAGHRAHRESLRTVKAVVTNTVTRAGSTKQYRHQFARSPDGWRIVSGQKGVRTEEVAVVGEEMRLIGLSTRNGQPFGHGTRRGKAAFFPYGNLWFDAVLVISTADGRLATVDELAAISDPPASAITDEVDSRRCVRVSFRMPSREGRPGSPVRVWLDPGRGYLTVRFEAAEERSTAEVKEVAEAVPGLYLPTVIERRLDNPSLSMTQRTEVTEWAVNRVVPAADLATSPLPPGSLVRDELTGTQYVADSNWRPAGPVKPMARYVVAVGRSPDGEDAAMAVSTDEPTESGPLLVRAALALLAVGVAGLVVRAAWRHRRGT